MVKMRREKLFAGYDRAEGKMAWIEVEIRVYEGKKTFTLSGTECYVDRWDRYRKVEYVEEYLENMEESWVLDRLKELDCKYSELADELIGEFDYNDMYGEHYYDVDMLYSDEAEFHCEVTSCGQCDIRKHVDPITPQIARLLELWDEYHLKEITDEIEQEVIDLVDQYEVVTEQMSEELYGGKYLPEAIFKDLCEYMFDEENLY